jgi:hypothetical protein
MFGPSHAVSPSKATARPKARQFGLSTSATIDLSGSSDTRTNNNLAATVEFA